LETKELLKANEEKYKKQIEKAKNIFSEKQQKQQTENEKLKETIKQLEEKSEELERLLKAEVDLHRLEDETNTGKK